MTTTNHLSQETSPYLLQHADNPVDWYPWGKEALERARQEGKPILLSIGYSACHWCHVMAHESFEDEETATLMNERFVNIKVDREERPDLDKIYQLAHNALTQRGGGWPLTMFLTPDQIPFFGGTYFPATKRFGLPAFRDILERVSDYLAEHPDEIAAQNKSLQSFFKSIDRIDHYEAVDSENLIDQCSDQLKKNFDSIYGGFGDSPKFPQCSLLELSLLLGEQSNNDELRHITHFTLQKISRSGLYDHIGGGFFRYSVDAAWSIPHFEKMLYDNGQLLHLMALGAKYHQDPHLEQTIDETVQWLQREMASAGGSFFAALDADVEKQEGQYYLWTLDEIKTAIDEQAYALIKGCYGLELEANFEGRWHLQLQRDVVDLATELNINGSAAVSQFNQARQKLLQLRQQRRAPARDNKLLCAWNALTIKGLLSAGIWLNKPHYIETAENALLDIKKKCWSENRLFAVHCEGQSRLQAYLDDYAFLLDATLLLLEAKWDPRTIDFAETLATALVEYFYDTKRHIFYFTANDHERLIHRAHAMMDESTPAGAAIAAQALLKLGYLLAQQKYIKPALDYLRTIRPLAAQSPLAHSSAVQAMLEIHAPNPQIIVYGEMPEVNDWVQTARGVCSAWTSIYSINRKQELPEAFNSMKTEGACTAYLCVAGTCKPPINNFEEFKTALNELHP